MPSVTAITFVALGTSMPDTFASKTAAETEPFADASIVNITGSNSVNVFLCAASTRIDRTMRCVALRLLPCRATAPPPALPRCRALPRAAAEP